MNEGAFNATRAVCEFVGRGFNTHEIARHVSAHGGVPFSEAQVCAVLLRLDEHAEKPTVGTVQAPREINSPTPREETRAIMRAIGEKHGVSVEAIIGQNRSRRFMLARCEAIRAVSAARPHWSYPKLGRLFGGRDQSSVKHHLDKLGLGRQTCACAKHMTVAEARPTINGGRQHGAQASDQS